MFVDYYQILEIKKDSTFEEVKVGFRIQANKLHPDKHNNSLEATIKMQLINEAYFILKDSISRKLYDAELEKYNQFFFEESKLNHSNENINAKAEKFVVKDELLNNFILTARRKAIKLSKEAKNDFIELSKVAIRAFFSKRPF